MNEKLEAVLQRMDSRHLSKLWIFYRNYFESDHDCLTFIYNTLHKEPPNANEKNWNAEGIEVNDRILIPRKMLNCIERMVSAARDMEQIRRGKDIFKIVFLVTCTETLEKLSGKKLSKKDMLFDFFENYTSDSNKKYIQNHFSHIGDETNDTEDSFWQFISLLNEYRNCATHEGEYWDFCFNDDNCQTPLLICAVAQLDNNSKKRKHTFQVTLSYKDFETIFVQNCIRFVENYIDNTDIEMDQTK